MSVIYQMPYKFIPARQAQNEPSSSKKGTRIYFNLVTAP
jgi:hypothetical protein